MQSSFFKSIAGDRKYTSATFADFFASLVTSGIVNGGTNLQVYANGTDANSRVKAGKGFIQGYYCRSLDEVVLAHDAAHATLDRIDRVVLRLDLNDDVRNINVFVKKGTPAASPAPPALTRTDLVYELSLAKVTITHNTTVIPAINVTDERLDASVCGLVNSLIQVDTVTMQAQFNAFMATLSGQSYIPIGQIGAVGGVAKQDDLTALSGTVSTHLAENTKKFASTDKAIAELLMIADIDSKIFSPNLNKFFTNFQNTMDFSMGTVDTFKQQVASISAGATSVTLPSVTGLTAGMEVSIQDATNYEDKIISSIVGSVVSFTSAAVNSYTNANVYRSNISGTGFGGVDMSTTYDRTTPVQVVNAAHTTDAHARPQVLSNGWIVTAEYDSATPKLILSVSKDNGATFAQLCYIGANCSGGFSITSWGTRLNVIRCGSTQSLQGYNIEATTVTNIDLQSTFVAIDTVGSSANNGCSISTSSTGILTCSWAVKDATYTNSFNIKSRKSTDGGVTWTKQDGTAGIDQITSSNTSGTDFKNPCVTYMNNGNPNIVWDVLSTSNSFIYSVRYTTAWQSIVAVYTSGSQSYLQSSPSATVQKYGANAGRIWVAWGGWDAAQSTNNIRVSYSDDNGATWSTMVKLTSEPSDSQSYPSVSSDTTGNIFLLWVGFDSSSRGNIRMIKFTTSWGAITEVTTGTNNYRGISICDNHYVFELPIMVYYQNSIKVLFAGKFTGSSVFPVLKNVVRMKISPYQAIKEISAWLTKSKITGYTTDGKVSIVASGATESYVDLVETSTDVSGGEETMMLGSVSTAGDRVTLKVVLNRASTADSATISKLIGGVS